MTSLPAQDDAGQRQQVFPRPGFALFFAPDGRDDGEGLCVLSPGEVEAVVGIILDHFEFEGRGGVFLHENKMHTFSAKENHK